MYPSQPTKYVMSLDSLDLSLLPTTYNSWLMNPTSLWTVNNLKSDDEYFQFEIKPKVEAQQESVKSEELAEQSTLCYICNTKVPAAYLLDHEDSLKHKSFAKIADFVLNRARKQMLKRESPLKVEKSDSKYFCEACVQLVEVIDRKIHERSKMHKHSVSLDKLLHELVAIYTDEDVEEFHKDDRATVDVNMNIDCLQMERNVNANNKQANDSDTVTISDLKATLDKKERDSQNNLTNTGDKVKVEYEEPVDQYDTKKFNTLILDGANVKIQTPDGFEVTVTQDNFHGFTRIGKRHIQCKLCKIIVKSHCENEHKNSQGHIRKIVKPFADKHCVRTLDDSWSHCIICNVIIDNSDVHALLNGFHTRLLQKALNGNSDDPSFPTDSNRKASRKRFCSTCNIYMDFNDVETHNNGYKHTANLKLKVDNDMEIDDADSESEKSVDTESLTDDSETLDDEHYCGVCNLVMPKNNRISHENGKKHAMNSKSPLHHIMKVVNDTEELLCRVCNVFVVDRLPLIRAHVLRPEHRNKLDAFLASNHVIDADDNSLMFCKPCNVFIRKMNEFYHIEKGSHVDNLAVYEANDSAVNAVNDSEHERPSYNAVLKQGKVTVGTNGHDKLNGSPIEDAKVTPIKQETDNCKKTLSFFCQCCNVHIPNHPNNITEHNNGERHRSNTKNSDLKKKASNPIVDQAGTIPNDQNFIYQMGTVKNEKELMCRVCKSIVPNKRVNVFEHVNGSKHRTNQKALMDDNQIERKEGEYYCNACKTFIADQNELVHIEQLTHKTNLHNSNDKSEKNIAFVASTLKTEKGDNLKVKTAQLESVASTAVQNNKSTEPTEHEPTNFNTIDLYTLLSHHFEETKDKKSLECRICFDTIPNSSDTALHHASEAKHKNKYIYVMKTHLMFETDTSEFFCGFCKCIVPGKGEIIHAFGLRHTKNRTTALKSADVCNLCNVSTAGQQMNVHVQSEQHITMLKREQTALYHCVICGCLLTKNDQSVMEHMKRCTLIKKHKLVVKDRICFCIICDLYFTCSLIEEHVNSQHHLLLYGISN